MSGTRVERIPTVRWLNWAARQHRPTPVGDVDDLKKARVFAYFRLFSLIFAYFRIFFRGGGAHGVHALPGRIEIRRSADRRYKPKKKISGGKIKISG